jgi:hypothetical protein
MTRKHVFFLVLLGLAACAAVSTLASEQTADTKETDAFITIGGQILVLIGALFAGGGLRYFLEPLLQQKRLRKVMATGLWLSCYELRLHLEAIKTTLSSGDPSADAMRNALLKIPGSDSKGKPDWFVKDGYFSMITAYKIAAFSAWMKIYQTAVLRALLTGIRSKFISDVFQKFDAYKVAASDDTVLWYNYLESIGEKIISTEGDLTSPVGFSEFCNKYSDEKFLLYFDQLHMFIHFMGRKDDPWVKIYPPALTAMIDALNDLENFLADTRENLLVDYRPKKRKRTPPPPELSKSP